MTRTEKHLYRHLLVISPGDFKSPYNIDDPALSKYTAMQNDVVGRLSCR